MNHTPVSLKKRAHFLALRSGKHVKTPFFLIQSAKRLSQENLIDTCPPRIGFTVSKKNGNAVTRNRIKRRLRAATYQAIDWSQFSGYDFNIIAYQKTLETPFPCLVEAIKKAILQKEKKGKL